MDTCFVMTERWTFYIISGIIIVILSSTAGPTVAGEEFFQLRDVTHPRQVTSSSDVIVPSESQPMKDDEAGAILDRITSAYISDSNTESYEDTIRRRTIVNNANSKDGEITSTTLKSSFAHTTARQQIFSAGTEAAFSNTSNNSVHPMSRTPPPYTTAKISDATSAVTSDGTRLINPVFPTATFTAVQSLSDVDGNGPSSTPSEIAKTHIFNSIPPKANISSYQTPHSGRNYDNRALNTAQSHWNTTSKTELITMGQTEMSATEELQKEEKHLEINMKNKDNTRKVNVSPNGNFYGKMRSAISDPNTEISEGIINNIDYKENSITPAAMTEDNTVTYRRPQEPVLPIEECIIGTNCSSPRGYIIIPKLSSGGTFETHVTAPENSFIRLIFNASLFNLQRNESRLMFGNGEVVKKNTIGTVFGEMHTHDPMAISSDPDMLFFSSNTHHMWLNLYITLRVWTFSKVYYEAVPLDFRPHEVEEAPAGEIVSPGFPDPYPSNVNATWGINVGKGYGIDITVETLDLDGNWDDFLLIAEGKEPFKGNRAGALSWTLEHMVIRIPRKHEAYIWFRSQNHAEPNTKMGFKLRYRRYGNLTTTEAPTTPPTTLPTPPPLLKTNLTVFALGKTPMQFVEDSMIFRQQVALMANVYCKDEDIPLNYTIQHKHVILNKIAFCHCDCEEDKACVKVTFSVIAFTETGYALPATELEVMIMRYGHILSGLHIQQEIGKDNFTYWLFGSIGTLAILMLVFLFVWRERRRSSYERQMIKSRSQDQCNGNVYSGSSSFDGKVPKALNPFFEEVVDDEGIECDSDYGATAYPASTASSDLVTSNNQQTGRVLIGMGQTMDMYSGSYDNRGFSDEEGNELSNQHHSNPEDEEDSESVTSSVGSSSLSNNAGHSILGKRSKVQGILPSVRFHTESVGDTTTETAL